MTPKRLKKLGSLIRLNTTSIRIAMIGMVSCPRLKLNFFLVSILSLTSRNSFHNLCLVQIVTLKLSYHMPVSHDYKPAACTEHLFNL